MSLLNWDLIDRLAKSHRLVDATADLDSFTRELRLWWCLKYNRPFKDPLLQSYTLDELLYEYLTYFYLDPDNDPVVQVDAQRRAQEDADWVKQQLAQIQVQAPPVEKPKEVKDSEKTSEATPIPELPEISTRFDP